MPDTPDSTRSDLAQLVAESDVEEQSAVKEDGDNGAVTSPAFNFVCSIVGPGILGAFRESCTLSSSTSFFCCLAKRMKNALHRKSVSKVSELTEFKVTFPAIAVVKIAEIV